jgi:hypothetical protein
MYGTWLKCNGPGCQSQIGEFKVAASFAFEFTLNSAFQKSRPLWAPAFPFMTFHDCN